MEKLDPNTTGRRVALTEGDRAGLMARTVPWAPYCDCAEPRVDIVLHKMQAGWPKPRRLEFCCGCNRPTKPQLDRLLAEEQQRVASCEPMVERCLEALAGVAHHLGTTVGALAKSVAPFVRVASQQGVPEVTIQRMLCEALRVNAAWPTLRGGVLPTMLWRWREREPWSPWMYWPAHPGAFGDGKPPIAASIVYLGARVDVMEMPEALRLDMGHDRPEVDDGWGVTADAVVLVPDARAPLHSVETLLNARSASRRADGVTPKRIVVVCTAETAKRLLWDVAAATASAVPENILLRDEPKASEHATAAVRPEWPPDRLRAIAKRLGADPNAAMIRANARWTKTRLTIDEVVEAEIRALEVGEPWAAACYEVMTTGEPEHLLAFGVSYTKTIGDRDTISLSYKNLGPVTFPSAETYSLVVALDVLTRQKLAQRCGCTRTRDVTCPTHSGLRWTSERVVMMDIKVGGLSHAERVADVKALAAAHGVDGDALVECAKHRARTSTWSFEEALNAEVVALARGEDPMSYRNAVERGEAKTTSPSGHECYACRNSKTGACPSCRQRDDLERVECTRTALASEECTCAGLYVCPNHPAKPATVERAEQAAGFSLDPAYAYAPGERDAFPVGTAPGERGWWAQTGDTAVKPHRQQIDLRDHDPDHKVLIRAVMPEPPHGYRQEIWGAWPSVPVDLPAVPKSHRVETVRLNLHVHEERRTETIAKIREAMDANCWVITKVKDFADPITMPRKP